MGCGETSFLFGWLPHQVRGHAATVSRQVRDPTVGGRSRGHHLHLPDASEDPADRPG